MAGVSWAYLPTSEDDVQRGQGWWALMQRQKVIPKPTLETQSGVSLPPSSAFPFTLALAAPVGNVCRVGSCGLSGEGRMLRMFWGN